MADVNYAQEASEGGVDDITAMLYRPWDELHVMEKPEVEAFQLASVRRRIEELKPKLGALASQIDKAKATEIKTLADLVPLLFQHTTYKSYPMSLIEKGRFDRLTEWLARVTSIDLSSVDASACDGIDSWLAALEKQSALMPIHTSGTSGKLSFFPRTVMEASLFFHAHLKKFTGFRDEPGVKVGYDGLRLPLIFPTHRHGRYAAQRLIYFMTKYVAPTPDQCYTQTEGTLSADLVSLSGRIRMAQAKGELSRMTLTASMRAALKRYIEEQENRPAETAAFLDLMVDKLRGQRVFITALSAPLFEAAQHAAARGVYGVFAPDSLMLASGGGKGTVLPPDWRQQVQAFTGISHSVESYGMSELTGTMTTCREGHFHFAPFLIVYLLNPITGEVLPRVGRQTGRFAAMDLLPSSYWGGIVTGDEMTIEFDRECSCGRKTIYAHNTITRYTESVTGDDKITCAATIDNTDAALQQLINL